MNKKLRKKLTGLVKHFEKKMSNPRIALVVVDHNTGDESASVRVHHNFCCRAHYFMALLEVVKAEAEKLVEDGPDAAAEIKEMINDAIKGDRTIH